MHLQDLLDNIDKLQGVEQLVVAHVSRRHNPYQNALGLLAAALPPSVINKVGRKRKAKKWCFLTQETKTSRKKKEKKKIETRRKMKKN